MRKKEIDSELLKKMYTQEDKTTIECAKFFNCSRVVIGRRLKEIGVSTIFKRCRDISDEYVVQLYDEGLSIRKVAEKIDKSDGFVKKALKRMNHNNRSISEGSRLWRGTSEITDEKIIELYDQGWSCEKISKYFGKSDDFARQRFIALNKKRRSIGFYNQDRRFLNKDDEIDLVTDYTNSLSLDELKHKYNIKSDSVIYSILHRYGFEHRDQSGANNASWRGGVTKLHLRIRNCKKNNQWRRSVLERDHYTCQITGYAGIKLHIHHKKSFSQIFQDFLAQYAHLDPMNDSDTLFNLAQSHNDFWRPDNGITVCEEIHRKLHE